MKIEFGKLTVSTILTFLTILFNLFLFLPCSDSVWISILFSTSPSFSTSSSSRQLNEIRGWDDSMTSTDLPFAICTVYSYTLNDDDNNWQTRRVFLPLLSTFSCAHFPLSIRRRAHYKLKVLFTVYIIVHSIAQISNTRQKSPIILLKGRVPKPQTPEA